MEHTLSTNEKITHDSLADIISNKYSQWRSQRSSWEAERAEVETFIYQTDTSHTSSLTTPWKNRTTIPKICHIRDNLHSNYMAGLFPNDDWLHWEGYSHSDNEEDKRKVIQAYTLNKVRESGFIETASQLLDDYIMGDAIFDVIWENNTKVDPETGETIQGYVGAKLVRVNPNDIVFDPTAITFASTPKITRSIISLGDLKLYLERAEDNPESKWKKTALEQCFNDRTRITSITSEDFEKANQYSIDGFGSLFEYYGSDSVEILEFEGTLYDPQTGKLLDDYIITVADRSKIVRKEQIPAWSRGGYKGHVAWRNRPNNIYGMGALNNLVGMQYRIDHLENAKADAWDLVITPMFKVIGNVDDFDFEPGGEVYCEEGSDIQPLTKPTEALQVNNEIQFLMNQMEEMAGSPKQAMGIRTPGEKTAFEVQSLDNASSRIFQQKITKFEREVIEPALNAYLELAVHHMNTMDVVRVIDDDLGVADFMEITKEDITAKGNIRPIGARHFAQRAQLLQNLTGIANSPIWQKVERHYSDKKLAKLVEDGLQLSRFELFADNSAMFEQAEAAQLGGQLEEENMVNAQTPIEEGGVQAQGMESQMDEGSIPTG